MFSFILFIPNISSTITNYYFLISKNKPYLFILSKYRSKVNPFYEKVLFFNPTVKNGRLLIGFAHHRVRLGFGKDADVSVTVSVNTCDAALDVTTSSFLSSSAEMPSDNVSITSFKTIGLTRTCESVVDICVET